MASVAASRRAKLDGAGPTAPDPFLVADTATQAAAKLDATMRDLALSSGTSLMSSRAEVKPDEVGLGTRIELQAVIEGQNEALQSVLLKVETGGPTVLVDGLALEPVEVEAGMATDPQSPRLRMTLTLSGYWRPARS